jgi:DNA-binding NarL/FixJ family response regulator
MHRVILADNQAIFRAGAARVLAQETDMRIVAQVSDSERLLTSIASFKNATALFSTGLKADMPTVLAALRESGSRGILIADKGETLPERSSELSGILGRHVTSVELIEAVKRVGNGQRCVQMMQAAAIQTQDTVGARVKERLTPKEMQIVALIVQGCKNKDIAMQLGTKEQVIKNYLRSIYDKTGVSDRLELALFTLHHRILAEAAAKVGSMLERRTA